ncbi:cellulose synthase complex periplasmic endoglucanase BcsZ [Vibrio variabilis]|uniref:cellulose synthase complex periplasmic endoglucanase BcsZ n=1 Tax=Vibrio variabilis TaxID=990271 RepID=UPI000DD58D0F|nr:cellulose synthase complex periplasmic endoglucanase BcsZ [Vibrio variabilis]
MRTWLFAFAMMLNTVAPASLAETWPQWQAFKSVYMTPEGRIVDGSDDRLITTSEGQSYAMFFALVANDKAAFDTLYNWTQQHLADGDLTARLPAWLWGKTSQGYGVIDSNSASDSDLWIAYTLIEAGRLWGSDYYQNVGYLLAKRILKEETVSFGAGNRQLLPGKQGFEQGDKVKLNPSYVPLPVLAAFAHRDTKGQWRDLYSGSLMLLLDSQRQGVSPDWLLYDGKAVSYDAETTDIGNYNAIRSYLWAGMMPSDMEGAQPLVDSFKPFVSRAIKQQYTPLNTYAQSGKMDQRGPVGFDAALLPLIGLNADEEITSSWAERVRENLVTDRNNEYYNNVLALFGLGWNDNQYRFNSQGELLVPWAESSQP